jgi:hypothetical protein
MLTLWAWSIDCESIAHQIVRYVHTGVARHACCEPIRMQYILVTYNQHIRFVSSASSGVANWRGIKLN